MRRKSLVISLSLLALGLAGWFAAAPYLTTWKLLMAVRTGDRQVLERSTDFEALRQSLQAQLTERFTAMMNGEQTLAGLVAPRAAEELANMAVRPEVMAAMLKSGRSPLGDVTPAKSALPPPEETAAPANPADAGTQTSLGYRSFNVFAVQVGQGDRKPITWLLERRGVIGWKLAGVELP